jgi:hypothetical protein
MNIMTQLTKPLTSTWQPAEVLSASLGIIDMNCFNSVNDLCVIPFYGVQIKRQTGTHINNRDSSQCLIFVDWFLLLCHFCIGFLRNIRGGFCGGYCWSSQLGPDVKQYDNTDVDQTDNQNSLRLDTQARRFFTKELEIACRRLLCRHVLDSLGIFNYIVMDTC